MHFMLYPKSHTRPFLPALVFLLLMTFAASITMKGATIIEDDFSNNVDIGQHRQPNLTALTARNYERVPTGKNNNRSLVRRGVASLETNLGAAIDITSTDDYKKPTQLEISAIFAIGTLTNNEIPRAGRGVYLGFWSRLPVVPADSQAHMTGIFINPDTGRLCLWTGASVSTAQPAQTLNYQGEWKAGDTPHMLRYKIDIDGSITGTPGNIYDCILDGQTYAWKKTTIFTDDATHYAGFGVSASTGGQTATIDHWSLKTP
ncbi:hypothetical protein OpiT1DRAFT_01854 [Opitutaceae bacterium TAV1]|nr:hypothetical protein OpiT1DRAFT_01854 [Opitutaceae bacterium TAV1]